MKKLLLKDGRTFTLRNAQKSDATAIVDFYNSISGETDFLSFGEGEFNRSNKDQEEIIEKFNEQDNGVCLITEMDNNIMGVITFSGESRPRIKHTGEFGIGIAKPYWGLGLGRIMIEALIEWAKESKVVRKIDLRTRTDNAKAIGLYESLGFIMEGKITRDCLVNNTFYDSYIMGLQID